MPKLSTLRITKRTVDALPTDRDTLYFDADLKGFGVRTKPSGSKTYLVQYLNQDGRSRRISIGRHGPLTPTEARQRAIVLLGQVGAGSDPAQERLLQKSALTVEHLCERYLEAAEQGLIIGKRGTSKKASTLATDRGRITRHILPLLGPRKVRELTSPDISRFLRDVAKGATSADLRTKPRGRAIVKGGLGTAARTVGLLGGILSFAVSEGIITANPVQGVRRPADGCRQVRLAASQYRALGLAIEQAEDREEAWQVTAAMRLLALTGCRRGEIERLRWPEVDIPGRCIRFSDTKTGASIRPIGIAAINVLQALRERDHGGSEYVLPREDRQRQTSPDKYQYYSGLPKAWLRVIGQAPASAELTHLTPHGLRHAFASVAHDLGFTEITIAALLGHAATSITGRYIHHVDTALIGAADRVAEVVNKFMNSDSSPLGSEAQF